MSQNGKGSKRRIGKPGAYAEGWDRIFGARRAIRYVNQSAVTIDEVTRRQSRCDGRDDCTNPPIEEHTCPYQVEINGNEEFTCTCCVDCKTACAWAV
jgi:hypothetical protein